MIVQRMRRLVWLGGLTLIVVLIWVALDGYHQLVSQEEVKKIAPLIRPLEPRLDEEVLSLIEKRREYTLEEGEKTLFVEELFKVSTSSAEATESAVRD